MTSRPSTLQDLLSRFRESLTADLHTSLPGKIVRYDATTQKADVQPLIKERYTDESGVMQSRDLPVIPAFVTVGARKENRRFVRSSEHTQGDCLAKVELNHPNIDADRHRCLGFGKRPCVVVS